MPRKSRPVFFDLRTQKEPVWPSNGETDAPRPPERTATLVPDLKDTDQRHKPVTSGEKWQRQTEPAVALLWAARPSAAQKQGTTYLRPDVAKVVVSR